MTEPVKRLRIGVAVHGRFHAFDLARGLADCGHDVTLFTNYPAPVAEHLGAPKGRVRSLVVHGLAGRALSRAAPDLFEPFIHRWFGGWVARQLARTEWDFTHVWSSIASEWLETETGRRNCVIKRGSAHIRAQRELLEEEAARVGQRIDAPSDWMVEREESEYARAPLIAVLSDFAAQSFIAKGIAADCVITIPLAASAVRFQVGQAERENRITRLRQGGPLRLVFVGSNSYRKGMYDLARIITTLPKDRFRWRFVGAVLPECAALVRALSDRVDVRGFQPEADLHAEYEWADALVLPSIEDGFGLVLCQAVAAGVPFIASTHSGGPDLVNAGVPGWVLPPRAPEKWIDLLLELDRDRYHLIDAVGRLAHVGRFQTWPELGQVFASTVTAKLELA